MSDTEMLCMFVWGAWMILELYNSDKTYPIHCTNDLLYLYPFKLLL